MQQTFQCYRCGSQNYMGQLYCWNCQSQFQYNCPNCKAPVEGTTVNCPYCRMPLPWQSIQHTHQYQGDYQTSETNTKYEHVNSWAAEHLNLAYSLWTLLIGIGWMGIVLYIIFLINHNDQIYIGGAFRWILFPAIIGLSYANLRVNLWITKKKNRHKLWAWLGLLFCPILLILSNKSDEIDKSHLELYLEKHNNDPALDEIRAMVARQYAQGEINKK